MDLSSPQGQWIWHPEWNETCLDTAGRFVYFRKSLLVPDRPRRPLRIQITADTKYRLFVNSRLVSFGPVKGDRHLWFYDEVDIDPFLVTGWNHLAVRVLRLFYNTPFATSFPRLESPGFLIRQVGGTVDCDPRFDTDEHWQAALDSSSYLPVNIKEDDFLHVYEDVDYQKSFNLEWVPAKVLAFPNSHGLTAPWRLSPRMIPSAQLRRGEFKAIHNVRSTNTLEELERVILPSSSNDAFEVVLKAGSCHHIELEAQHHLTAFLKFRFKRPVSSGSTLRITYSECYENEPVSVPYLRKKDNRCDISKTLYGPYDIYKFGGVDEREIVKELWCESEADEEESFSPFHFRTFRFLTLDIQVAEESDLVLKGIDVTLNNYPLHVKAEFYTRTTDQIGAAYEDIWSTSIRTLSNCLHDCYEDCPFYEQLQYAMDTRSSALFTYSISHDDSLARQAIVQLHNSYVPSLGLTASRAPAHQQQIIPHFSLYWICMVRDHFAYFGDADFTRCFSHTCDGVLEHFSRQIDPEVGLVRHDPASLHWLFVDWTYSWRPLGIPPAGVRTGYLSYTNMLYAYALGAAAEIARGVGREVLAAEYDSRGLRIVQAIRTHCFDGQLFTDGLASEAVLDQDYSQHSQIWAVLSGAATGQLAEHILEQSLAMGAGAVGSMETIQTSNLSLSPVSFSPTSTAMSFYALRALSMAGGKLYNALFHRFWDPWRTQLSHNLTTWEEDSVSQRSDCHAWGCALLYEYSAEVAGIRPGKPGWEVIHFNPRMSLFQEFQGVVPFGDSKRCVKGLAKVKWYLQPGSDKTYKISLKLETCQHQEGKDGELPPVEIRLPDGSFEVSNEGFWERVVVLD